MRTRKIMIIIVAGFSTLHLSSCITSFHPLFTSETLVTDDQLAGTWKTPKGEIIIQKFNNSQDREIFTGNNIPLEDSILYSKFYIVNFKSGGYNYSWSGSIARIDGQEFISLSADECLNQQKQSAYPANEKGYEYLNTFTFARLVWKNKSELEVQFLNGSYIKQTVLDNRVRIKHEYDKLYNSFIITDETAEMTKFLEKYKNDERLYDKANSITLIRKS